MTELYKKVEKFVDNSFAVGRHQHSAIHSKLTAEVVKELRPNANEAILIAALSHDIDRAFNDRIIKGDEYKEQPYLKEHQESSANIIKEFLEKIGTEKNLIDQVWHLASKHEEGGDEDQNLLKDADSLSYFRGGNSASIKKLRYNFDIKGKINLYLEKIERELLNDKNS